MLPRAKVLRLSQQVYGVPSLAAVGIAAHEAGEGRPVRAARARNYDQVADLVADRVKATLRGWMHRKSDG